MWYLIGSLFLFYIAYRSYRSDKLNKFRDNLQSGDECSVLIGGTFYEAEIEDVQTTTVFVVIKDENSVTFNNRVHITDIYPLKRKK